MIPFDSFGCGPDRFHFQKFFASADKLFGKTRYKVLKVDFILLLQKNAMIFDAFLFDVDVMKKSQFLIFNH